MKASEIANMAGGRIISGDIGVQIREVFIDSRDVTKGSGFVALIGETTDGHRFIQNAYENGASVIHNYDCNNPFVWEHRVFG